MPIQWTPDLALGIPELDGQHLQIDAHLRLLHDPICEGRTPDVAAIIQGLRGATARHFEAEERLMLVRGYPRVDEHRAEHRSFTEKLAEFESSCRRDGATTRLAMGLANCLAEWLRDHQRHDLDLRRYAAPDQAVGGG